MHRGLKLLEEGKYLEATQAFSQLLQRYPDSADAHHALGVIAMEQGHFDEAYLFVHTALSLSEENSIFHTTMGNIFLHLHNYKGAGESFMQAVEQDPTRIEYRLNLANFYLTQAQYSVAIEQFNIILQRDSESYLGLRGKTVGYLFAKEYKNALKGAADITKSYSMQHEPLYIYGLCLYANQSYVEALKYFDQALAIFPNYHEAISAIAACHLALNNNVLAESMLHRSLSIEPNNPAALYLLTCIKYNQGQHKVAKDLFINAVRLDIEFPSITLQNIDKAVLHCTNNQCHDPLFFLKCSGADYWSMLNSTA